MLKFTRRRSAHSTTRVPDGSPRSVADTNPDLRIRNLLDDPRLQTWFASPIDPGLDSGLPTRVRGASMSPALREGVPPAAA